jgi:hypothetical protein
MVRLTKLRVDRFRNVKAGTEIDFGPAFNILLGKNASGKTTLLDLVAALTNDDPSPYRNEEPGFDLTWRLERDDVRVDLHVDRRPMESAGKPQRRITNEERFAEAWTIAIHKAGTLVGEARVDGAHGTWHPTGGTEQRFEVTAGLGVRSPIGRTLLAMESLPVPAGQPNPAFYVYRALGDGGHVGRLDEAVSSLGAIAQARFREIREGTKVEGQYGSWLPWELIDLPATEGDRGTISFDRLRSLKEVPRLLGFASGEVHPHVQRQTQDGSKTTIEYEGLDFFFRRDDGSLLNYGLLSFGQKRVLAFLWYLAVRGVCPVIADELSNGLHYEWIEACIERLRDRQSFLAAQHPLLLDSVPIASAADVRTTFVRCSVEKGDDGRERLVWRNFTEDEAARFFVAYQTGIQHVSEVLRTEGLW